MTEHPLVAFLRARLDEDERAAMAWREDERVWQVVGGRRLSYNNGSHEDVVAIDVTNRSALWWERIYVKRDLDGLAKHIARHDPARVLADIAAKRRIIDRIEKQVRSVGPHLADTWVLRELAQRYDDHEDYQEAWRL